MYFIPSTYVTSELIIMFCGNPGALVTDEITVFIPHNQFNKVPLVLFKNI
jgi:hypothetical protein